MSTMLVSEPGGSNARTVKDGNLSELLITAKDGTVIKLKEDCSIPATSIKKDVVIDLDGHELSLFEQIRVHGHLTIRNGALYAEAPDALLVVGTGSELTLEGVSGDIYQTLARATSGGLIALYYSNLTVKKSCQKALANDGQSAIMMIGGVLQAEGDNTFEVGSSMQSASSIPGHFIIGKYKHLNERFNEAVGRSSELES